MPKFNIHRHRFPPFFGADIKASFSVASYYDVFDSETGQLADAELSNTLRESLAKL
jgi:hypothetical protein